jgi:hypothetical protein
VGADFHFYLYKRMALQVEGRLATRDCGYKEENANAPRAYIKPSLMGRPMDGLAVSHQLLLIWSVRQIAIVGCVWLWHS